MTSVAPEKQERVRDDMPQLDYEVGVIGGVWHSARWDHDYDLKNKKVAIIGTGATSVQLVPTIAPEVERLLGGLFTNLMASGMKRTWYFE